jgi:hypothetical protein
VSAHAAHKKAKNKPFLVLIGGEPPANDFVLSSNPRYCGGVSLETANTNEARASALAHRFSIPPERVALIFNPNSRSGRRELRTWKQNNNTRRFAPAGVDDVTRGSNPAQAVIISGDPFFAAEKINLVQAANASTLRVCYPFKLYGQAVPPPNSVNSIWLGPDLLKAYYTLGLKAAQLFPTTAPPFPDLELDKADIIEGDFTEPSLIHPKKKRKSKKGAHK